MNIEDLLRQTLSDMAREESPPSPGRFLQARQGVRPPRRGLALTAAATVALVVAGSTLAVQGLSTRSTPAEHRTSQPTGAVAPPLAKVWPYAVHSVPETLPNGQKLSPELFIDDHTVLARTGGTAGHDKMGLWAYDIGSGKARRLADFVPPSGVDYTSDVMAGGGQLVWQTTRRTKAGWHFDIWAVPVTGGAQRKVTSFDRSDKYGDLLDAMTIAEGRIMWSRYDGGVYQVPLSGGEPALIPGTRNLLLFRWPWLSFTQPPASGERATSRRLTNMRTQEKREAVVKPGENGWNCAVTWCVQLKEKRARRRDGTGERALPGWPTGSRGLPVLDRFLILMKTGAAGGDPVLVLYDLSTGREGDLGRRPGERGGIRLDDVRVPEHGASALLTYDLGGRNVIVNLAAIR
jgi:hypothetical protein